MSNFLSGFLSGINFVIGIITVLIIEMGSIKINNPKFVYDSKTARPLFKHTIAIIVALVTLSILTHIP